ncbi:MAG: FixH family protein [Nitrospiria bacterium]
MPPEHLENGLIEKNQQGMVIRVELSPRLAILGENKVIISLKDRTGLPIEDAHLNISSSSTLPGMKIERVEINHGTNGNYSTKLHYMSVGQWKLTLAIHLFGQKEVKNIFLFDVIGHS